MPNVLFAAPILSENASRMIEAAASLRDVRLGVITQDPAEKMSKQMARAVSAHWRVDDILDAGQLAWAAEELGKRLGGIDRLFGASPRKSATNPRRRSAGRSSRASACRPLPGAAKQPKGRALRRSDRYSACAAVRKTRANDSRSDGVRSDAAQYSTPRSRQLSR